MSAGREAGAGAPALQCSQFALLKTNGSSLTQIAYERLRDDVLSGQIRPSQKLKIHALMQRLDVSQGAVREALSRLASEGLVESEPQKAFAPAPSRPPNCAT